MYMYLLALLATMHVSSTSADRTKKAAPRVCAARNIMAHTVTRLLVCGLVPALRSSA